MLFAAIAAPIVRKRRGKNAPNEQDFIVTGFALGSAIALFKVLIKLLTQEKLQTELDWDDTIAPCISFGY